MIKAIIFDCFGVLVSDALQVVHDELRVRNPGAADEVTSIVRATNRGLLEPEQANRNIAELMGIDFDTYQQKIRDGEVKDPRLMQLITELRGAYKIGMLSNISAGGLAKRFTPEELSTCFDAVIASSDVGYAKPDAKVYEITAERLGVTPAECLFTDDRLDFCNAAEAVGMQAIQYRSFDQFKVALDDRLHDR